MSASATPPGLREIREIHAGLVATKNDVDYWLNLAVAQGQKDIADRLVQVNDSLNRAAAAVRLRLATFEGITG